MISKEFYGILPKNGGRLAGSFFYGNSYLSGSCNWLLFKLVFSEILEAGDAVVGFYYVSFEIYLAACQIGMVD